MVWEFGRFLKDSVEVRPWCWEVEVRPGSWEIEIGPCRQTTKPLPLGHRQFSFLPLRHVIGFLQISIDWYLKHHGIRSAIVRSDSMVSIVRIVSLSSCRRTVRVWTTNSASKCICLFSPVFCICMYYSLDWDRRDYITFLDDHTSSLDLSSARISQRKWLSRLSSLSMCLSCNRRLFVIDWLVDFLSMSTRQG